MQEKPLRNRTNLIIVLLTAGLALSHLCYSQTPDEAYLQGSADVLLGNYENAVYNLTIAITYNNASEELFIKRGASFLGLKEYDRAIADFQEANLIYPGIADLWLARTYAYSGEDVLAVRFLGNHLNSEFRVAEDSIRKDNAFDRLQETSEWHDLWQKNYYTSIDRVIADAEYYAEKKNFDNAQSVINNELIKHPDNNFLLVKRAQLYVQQGNYQTAIADYSDLIRNDKNNTDYYIVRGEAYLAAHKYKDAVSDFNRVIRNDPARFNIYLLRAASYAGLSSWDEAIENVEFYLKYFKNNAEPFFKCGEYCYYAGDYINALKYFNLSLDKHPENSRYLKLRGMTYYQTAVYRYAFNDLSMSLDLDPTDAETWMMLGLVKQYTGDKTGGCSDLHKAYNMGENEALKYIAEYCGE